MSENFTERELDTLYAALRYYHRDMDTLPPSIISMAEGDHNNPLTPNEVDWLADKLEDIKDNPR